MFCKACLRGSIEVASTQLERRSSVLRSGAESFWLWTGSQLRPLPVCVPADSCRTAVVVVGPHQSLSVQGCEVGITCGKDPNARIRSSDPTRYNPKTARTVQNPYSNLYRCVQGTIYIHIYIYIGAPIYIYIYIILYYIILNYIILYYIILYMYTSMYILTNT